jgi:hypothetical protein
MSISKSPNRNTFQEDNYIKRCETEGKEPRDDYIDMFKTIREQKVSLEQDPEWQKNNLEHDLRSTDWMLEKVRTNNNYAQNLYAAMCNNEFQRLDTWQILKDETWGCSWRSAGGIVANMQEKGDYIDWYCSGIQNHVTDQAYMDMTQEEKDHYETIRYYVSEGVVTEEIKSDLNQLGWRVVNDDVED